MKYQLQVTIAHKDSGNLQNYVTSFNLSDNISVANLKEEIKGTIKLLDRFLVNNETLYLGNTKLKDTDIVPTNKSGLQYFLEVKDNKVS